MALYTSLGTGTISTTSAAVCTVPAGEVWMVHSITIAQAAAGLAKEIAFTVGATATLVNAHFGATFAAGIARQILYPGVGLVAGTTLNLISSADNNVATYSINGFKQKTV